MSQPLLRVVSLFAMGVVLAGCQDPGVVVWAGGAVVGLITSLTLPRFRVVTTGLLLVSLGGANLSVRNHIWTRQDLRRVVSQTPVLASVRGRLASTPRITQHTREDRSDERTHAELRVTEVRLGRAGWQPGVGRLAVSCAGTLPRGFHQGRAVEVDGVLSIPPPRCAPGLFDYGTYLRNKGIHYQLTAEQAKDWRLLDPTLATGPPWTERFVSWSRRTLARGLPDNDPATGLIQAMTLGWKTALTDEVEEPFMKSGTMHVFAISGLHIFLMAGMLMAVLRLFRIPRGICGSLVIPLLWFYCAATGWQPSAARATIMMTIVLGGWSLQRPSNLLNSLAGAALVILAFDPHQVFQASFQFSFAVVLSLALVLPPLQQQGLRLIAPDPMLAPKLVPRWRTWVRSFLRWTLLTFLTSAAAWLGAMPLTAHYFHLASPGTLLANVLLIPCASATLASALASLACGFWCPWLSDVFNHGAWFWMHCMIRISTTIAELPGAYQYVASPGLPALTVYYGTLLVVAFGCRSSRRLKVLLTVSCGLLGIALGCRYHALYQAGTLTVLPLHGGAAVHVKPPGQFSADLVDCGNVRAFGTILEPFLQARGEDRLDTLFLTHGDTRHIGAGPLVLEEFPPTAVGISHVRFRSTAYRQLVTETIPARLTPTLLEGGEPFGGWQILYPSATGKATRADEAVLVLARTIRGTRFLLLSDLDRRGQRQLLDAVDRADLAASILVVGLAVDREPMVRELLGEVAPELIIVCDDEWPAGRRATPEMLSRFDAYARVVLSTRTHGALCLQFTASGWQAVDASGKRLAEKRLATGLNAPEFIGSTECTYPGRSRVDAGGRQAVVSWRDRRTNRIMIPDAAISEIIEKKGAQVWSVGPDTMVYDAIQLMAEKNIGALPVVENDRLVGVMSERDYTRKVVLKGKSSKTTPVQEILTASVVTVTPQSTVQECLGLMTRGRIRHLPILDGDAIVGIVSIGDLVNWVIGAQSSTIHQLNTYISGYPTAE